LAKRAYNHHCHIFQLGAITHKGMAIPFSQEARQLTERVSETTLAQIEYCMTTIPQPHSAAEVQKRLNKPEFRSRHRTYDEFGIPEGEEDEMTSTSTRFLTETQTTHRPTAGSEEGSEVPVPHYTSFSEGMDLARRKKENQCELGTHCLSAAPDENKRLHTLDLAPPPRQLAPPRTPYKSSVHVQMPKGQVRSNCLSPHHDLIVRVIKHVIKHIIKQ
jgi:hypothetical protein